MNVLVCVEPGRLELQSRPEPVRAAGDALVRPRHVGICGTDYHIYEGKHPYLKYPRVMGHELAVEVVEPPTGANVAAGETCVVNPYISCGQCSACRRGKPNCCARLSVLGVHQDGGMADLLALPAGNLIRAEGLSADQCATVEFLAIGAHAVRRGQVTGQDRVLVVGAGPIGLGTAIFARLAGGDVIVFDSDAERMTAAAAIAGTGMLPAAMSPVDAVHALTAGEGFDVVFDATGNAQAMEAGFQYVAHGGRYVFVSIVRGPITFDDPVLHGKEMTLYASRNATNDDFATVIAAIRSGAVDAGRLITHRTTLARAVDDIPRWAVEKRGLTKALIDLA